MFRCRFFQKADLEQALGLLRQDQGLFGPDLWGRMPELLPDWMERKRLIGGVVEDLDTGKLVFFGMTGWSRPETIARVREEKPRLFRDALLRREAQRKQVLLSPKQVAEANGRGELALVHFGGCPEVKDFTQERGFEVHRMAFSFFMTVHAGYRIGEFWQENLAPEASLHAESMGMSLVQETELGLGQQAKLFCFRHSDAVAKPGAQLAYLMKYPPGKLGFTPAQQRLLELALLDYSDAAAAEELGVSAEAVRKRWRAIHQRHNFGEGKEQRRGLLGYVRQHMEELRPWPRGVE
jgi:hypothetical protein